MVAPRLMADRPSPIESKASSIVYTFVGDLRTVSVSAISLRDGLLGWKDVGSKKGNLGIFDGS